MNKHFTPAISEEKFAAWLDGMLPADEMMQVESIVGSDEVMHDIYNTSRIADEAISNYDQIEGIPDVIMSSNFEVPMWDNDFHQFLKMEDDFQNSQEDFNLMDSLEHDESMFVNDMSNNELSESQTIELEHNVDNVMLDPNNE